MRSPIDVRFVFVASVLVSGQAQAASLKASPISVEVAAPAQAAPLTLSNTGDAPLTAQIRVMRWSQQDGIEKLEPTTDLVASPPMAQIGPKKEQIIRLVRVAKTPVVAEDTYRLIVDEVPNPAAAKAGQINIALRYSIPVFFTAPTSGKPQLAWSIARRDGKLVLTAVNSGTRRLRVADLRVTDASGAGATFGRGLVGYVLARSSMRWTVPAPAKLAKSGSVAIRAHGDDGPIDAQANLGH